MKIEQLNKDTFKVSIETNIENLPYYVSEFNRIEKTKNTKTVVGAYKAFELVGEEPAPRRRGPDKKPRTAKGNSNYDERLLQLRKTGAFPSDIAKQLRKEGYVSARGRRLTGALISSRLWYLDKKPYPTTTTGPNGGVVTHYANGHTNQTT
jgi:hypothetical protein